MVLEIAQLSVRFGSRPDFEAAFVKAQPLLMAADGYLAHELQRALEDETRYALLIEWEDLERHALGFRQSRVHAEWRAALDPYYDLPPQVAHYTMVAGRGIAPRSDAVDRHYAD